MKKCVVVLIIIISLVLFIILRDKDKSYEINYKISNYEVKEKYIDGKGYYIYILKNNIEYPFFKSDNFKEIKIVNDIEIITKDDYSCVKSIFIDASEDVICYDEGFISPYMLGLVDEENDDIIKHHRLSVYNKLDDGNYLIIWNYKGIDIIGSDIDSINYLSSDIYHNTHGVMIDKYYLTPDYSNDYEFSKFIVVDVTTKKISFIELEDKISYDSYIMGCVDDKLYLFDNDSLIQYEIDVVKKKIKVIGNKTLGGKYYDKDIWINRSIYDFHKEKLLFKYNYEYETVSSYYLYKNNIFYRIYKDNDTKIALFKMSEIQNIKALNDIIYFLKGDTIYMYSDKDGLREIVSNSEFIYNNLNIFASFNNK